MPRLLAPLTTDFSALAALALAANFFASGLGPLIDSAALELVEGTKQSYGDLRLWGTLGYISYVLLVGWMVQNIGPAWPFYVYAISLGMAGLVALGLPARQRILRTHILCRLAPIADAALLQSISGREPGKRGSSVRRVLVLFHPFADAGRRGHAGRLC